MKKQNGITLIALIITVIVLLILAGITINLTIGEDGIIKRAEQAGKNYVEAARNEETQLAEFTNLTDRLIDNVTKNHYTIVEGVPVPKGFTHIEGTKDTGFVIQNDTDGNEFVWVPCTIDGANGSIKYDRYAFTRDGWDNSQTFNIDTGEIKQVTNIFIEKMPTDEATSIKTYEGFYIGRYETGISDYTSIDIDTSNTAYEYTGYTGGKAVIKAKQQVWNYITREKAKSVSEELYSKTNGDSINSSLCSSYAWDTVLKFIDIKNNEYSTKSTQGNYSDKATTLGKPAKTGLTEAVNNIYDMGGNVSEWTTEKSNNSDSSSVYRGGDFYLTSNLCPAAFRYYASNNHISNCISFRTTLYL